MDILIREYGCVIWQKRWAALTVFTGMLFAIGLEVVAPVFYKEIANALAQPYSPETLDTLLHAFLMVCLTYLGVWIGWRVVEFGIIPLEAGGLNILDKRCFEVLLRQSYPFFESRFSGSLVKQANRFVRAYESIMDWLIFNLLSSLISIGLAFAIFWWQQPDFAIYFLIWAFVFIAWTSSYSIWKLKFDERVAEWDSKLGGAYSDNIANIFIVKSFALEQKEQGHLNEVADETFRRRRLAWILMFISFAVQGILAFGIELLLVYLMIGKWQQGEFNVGEFVLFQTVLLVLVNNLWNFGQSFRSFFTALADAKEMAEIFRQTDIEQDVPGTRELSIQKGEIHFKQLSFYYGQQEKHSNRLFQNFNLNIKAGEKVALVGYSGSGKTSLTKLLFRFVEPQSGNILIDGHNLKDFTLPSLRRQISLIPQQPELFHRSIRDNMALGQEVDEATLKDVAQKARALEFIEQLPEQFDTLVGERGVKLSGGEKQRVAIARAFLDNAPIVVLDEATSALDSITEQDIQVAIFDLIKDKTAIVIAHRLATILRMDRIIVLDHGRIIEQGTHNDLLKAGGHYYQMWQHQSGEFL